MLGAIAGTLYYNCNRYGTLQTPPKAPIWVMPSHLKCELSRRNPCTPLEADFVLPPQGPEQRLSLKVRVGRPNGACERYCNGTTGRARPVYRCAWPLIVGCESYQNPESRALPRAHARQGKETVHLVGNHAL